MSINIARRNGDDFGAEAACFFGKARGADEIRLHLRQRAFVELGEVAEEHVADHEAEHGVAEELEGLVVTRVLAPRFVRVRLVSDGSCEQVAPLKGVADAPLEFG